MLVFCQLSTSRIFEIKYSSPARRMQSFIALACLCFALCSAGLDSAQNGSKINNATNNDSTPSESSLDLETLFEAIKTGKARVNENYANIL